jgi:hypothetical protein
MFSAFSVLYGVVLVLTIVQGVRVAHRTRCAA